MLTLDILKRRGRVLANKCFLCEEMVEIIDHLLLHCSKARLLWDLLLAVVGVNWIFPLTVRSSSFLEWVLCGGKNLKKFGWQPLS